MKRHLIAACAALSVISLAAVAVAQGYIYRPWAMPHKWSRIDQLPRHHAVKTTGVPQPYLDMHNPLPASPETVARGEAVFMQHCQSCHGATGKGDGPEGRRLRPRPGDLAWLSEMRVSQLDGFLYWSIAEGGAPFGSPMPAYQDRLSSDEIWAVSAFIQAHLPRRSR